jgi:hypothetical protein
MSRVFKFDKSAPDGFKWGFQLDEDPERICFAKLWVISILCSPRFIESDWILAFSDGRLPYRYLDPSQIAAAEALATFSTKLGRLPPNRKVTDGISRYLAALRAVAKDRMVADWTKGSHYTFYCCQ